MPSSRTSDIVVAIVVVILSVSVFLYTFTFPESHRSAGVASFPRLLTGFMVILAGLLLYEVRDRRGVASKGSQESCSVWDRKVLTRVGIVTLMIAGYVALVRMLGFIITTIIFLLVTISYFGEKNILRLVLVAVGITGAVYLLFGVLAGVPFPSGSLFWGLWG